MIRLPPDFKEFLKLFNEKNVEYLLIGGYAVSYHGHPRATGDMDLWVSSDRGNIERTVDALGEFGFAQATVAMFEREHPIVRMGVPPVRIEIMTSISGVTFEEAWKARIADTLDGVPVWIIDKASLIRNKQAAGRAKDRSDVDQL